MRTLSVIVLVFVATWSLARAQTNNPLLADTIKEWKTLRVSFAIDGGDYNPPTTFVLLQRLDAERIVLSAGLGDYREELLPEARAIINSDAAQKIIDRALAFYAQAQKEIGEKARVKALPPAERDAIYKKSGFGISAFYISIEVRVRNRAYEYEDDFADESASIGEFREFLMQYVKPK